MHKHQQKRKVFISLVMLFLLIGMNNGRSTNANEIWFVNARTASWTTPNESEFQKIQVRRLNESSGCWDKSSIDDFARTNDPDVPTIVLIHGNHFTVSDAIDSGFQFQRLVLNKNPFRLVIWAWPSEKIPGIRTDAQVKAFYSEIQGDYLARFLRCLPEGSKVGLVGFSFGARTICEAVKRFQSDFDLQLRVLLLAPAIDQCSVISTGEYGGIFTASEKSAILYNPTDRALKYYPKMYQSGCGGPNALGREGISLSYFAPDIRERIKVYDVSNFSGKKHSFPVYFYSSSLNKKMRNMLDF